MLREGERGEESSGQQGYPLPGASPGSGQHPGNHLTQPAADNGRGADGGKDQGSLVCFA